MVSSYPTMCFPLHMEKEGQFWESKEKHALSPDNRIEDPLQFCDYERLFTRSVGSTVKEEES